MKHRSYSGKVLYLTDGKGEMGREYFRVTIQPDGTRTMRATCEMDDDSLLRDVVITLDPSWQPIDAFVRLTIQEQFSGASWFRFTDEAAECEGHTAKEGRISQSISTPTRTNYFGTHPVHSDAWGLAKFKERVPGGVIEHQGISFTTSHSPNGGTGPYLMPNSGRVKRRYIGAEEITVSAGTYKGHHFQMLFSDYPPIDIWATDQDCVPLRLRWDLLKQTYELVELNGDWR